MDIIRKKLELIDFKLALSPAYIIRLIIDSSPLVLPAVGLIVGIILQNIFSLPISLWLVLSVLFIAVAFIIISRKIGFSSYTIPLIAFVCAVSLGAIRLTGYHRLPASDISNFVGSRQTLATIRGQVLTDPYTNRNDDWAFAKFKFYDPAGSFYLKLNEVQTAAGWEKVTGVVRVYVNEPVLNLKTGDYIQLYCWLERFSPPTNPGQFDVADYLARKNIFVSASVDSRRAIELLQSTSAGTFLKIKRHLRQIAAQSLLGSPNPQDESENLLQALVLGLRADIDSATYKAFRQTGLLHFVCLSGLNFVILIAFIWWLCSLTGFGKKSQALICIAVSILFVLVVPSNPPVLRAAVMCLVFCASFLFTRQPNSFNSLALSAIILLLFKPSDLYNVGWQLSFSTTLGILLFCRRIQFFLYEKIASLYKQMLNAPKFPFFKKELSIFNISGLFSTGVAAWLGGAGLMLYHFYTITPLTSIWTVLASPFIAVISILGYIKLLIGLLIPTAASILDIVIKPLSDLLVWLVKLFAGFNISEILIGRTNGLVIVLYYGFLFFTAFVYLPKPLLKKSIASVWVVSMFAFLIIAGHQIADRNNLVLTCLDVGHGQSILAQLPGGKNLLFDAGSLLKSNSGRRIIIPYLRFRGIDKLDAIIISHNDIDHINAIPEIVDDLKVDGVYANDDFFIDSTNSGAPKFLSDSLKTFGFEIQNLDKLQTSSPTDVKIIWPLEDVPDTNQLSDNDRSAVTLITYAGVNILLCSDIEKFAQQKILEFYPALKADIVVVPHHGSTATLDKDFLKSLDADVFICSGDIAQPQIRQFLPGDSRIFFTGTDGAVQVLIAPDGRTKIKEF